MRILEIVSGRAVNGAVVHGLALAKGLADRGHDVTMACRPGAWIGDQLRSGSVTVVESDLYRWPTHELRRMASLIRRKEIDVVHTHMSRAHLFGVLLKCFVDIPVVATAHNRRLQPHWMFNDAVIAVSNDVRVFQQRYNRVRADRLRVTHPFIDTGRFRPVFPEERRGARARLGFEDSVLVLGVVGSIFREKRVAEVVAAYAKVHRDVPNARLLLVGEGPPDYVEHVKASAARLGVSQNVIWAGRRGDIPLIMGALDVLVLASEEETFSLVLAEAMAVGRPVVAAVAGVAETVVDGVTGLLVRPGDEAGLVEALKRLLRDPQLRSQLGEAGRAHVTTRFSEAVQLEKIEAVFAEVAEASSRHRPGPPRPRHR